MVQKFPPYPAETISEQAPKTARPDAVKKVLILMSETGGGHRAAAEAIQEGLHFLYKESVSVTIVDAWKNHMNWPLNRLANVYGWLVNEAIWLWKLLWWLAAKPRLVNIFLRSICPLIVPGFRQLFQSHQPNIIVSVHPLLNFHALIVLKRTRMCVPFVTVVTDMVWGYPAWYQPQTDLCLVPTAPTRRQALELGLAPEKVRVVGQPVALKFAAGIGEKAYLRGKLGLDLDRPAVLIAGGGEGYGPVFEIARCLAGRLLQAQLIIVAGRNKSLKKRLEWVDWEIPTTIFGFVTNMPDLMGAADIFVTKAGPGSISEAFITGLPLILYDYIPGHEEHNLRYVEKHRAGLYVPHPAEIAAVVADWLRPGNPILAQMAENAAGLARPDAALTIARQIYEAVE